MKKIVRLTESDLVRLVKRVISEQLTQMGTGLKKRQDLIGKSFKKDGKENEIIDVYEITTPGIKGFLIKGSLGGSGMIDKQRGYLYLGDLKSDVMSGGFNWDTKTNSFTLDGEPAEPSYMHPIKHNLENN